MALDFDDVEYLFKTGESTVGNCPGLSRAGGGILVTGKRVTDATSAQVPNVGDDEMTVWVPLDVLDPERVATLREYGGSL